MCIQCSRAVVRAHAQYETKQNKTVLRTAPLVVKNSTRYLFNSCLTDLGVDGPEEKRREDVKFFYVLNSETDGKNCQKSDVDGIETNFLVLSGDDAGEQC